VAGQAREIGLATEADIESVAEALGIDIGTVGDLGDLIGGADHPFGEEESDRELVVVPRRPHRHRDARAIDADRERLDLLKRLLAGLPETNWLRRNPFLGDHLSQGDAGLFDLFLHARDRAYRVPEVAALTA
jgi:hypothetical protein